MKEIDQLLQIGSSSAAQDISTLGQMYNLFLGGSRRMAERAEREIPDANSPHPCIVNVNHGTDWDYYATYTPKLESSLIDLGWSYTQTTIVSQNGEDYLDSEAVCILYKDKHEIVLRKDAEFYKTVFENIPVWFYAKFLWKSTPYRMIERQDIQPIFEMLFDMYRRFGNVEPS